MSTVHSNNTIITRSIELLDFADDIDLIGIDRRAVKKAYAPLKSKTGRIDLLNSSIKKKYMIAVGDRGRPSADVVIEIFVRKSAVPYREPIFSLNTIFHTPLMIEPNTINKIRQTLKTTTSLVIHQLAGWVPFWVTVCIG